MQLALIGTGAIGTYVRDAALSRGHTILATLVRPARVGQGAGYVSDVADLPEDVDLVVDCAGHGALKAYGADILGSGTDLLTLSIGAMADAGLQDDLARAAASGSARLHLATGAIGALDALSAAGIGHLESVRYTGRKPPAGWAGSPAEDVLDLAALTSGETTHFTGSAREAALAYPKNANVAAAVALAGIGFDATEVALIADADAPGNRHEVIAHGDFGTLRFEVTGKALPDNPKSSALAAMSAVAGIERLAAPVGF